jgi:O-antigen/teichoic acid export membrane protein
MPKNGSLRRRFGAGILWNSVTTLAVQGGTFVTNLIIANLIDADRFGQFGLVIGTAQTVGGVLQFSTGMAATKYLGELRDRDKERASIALGVCSRISLWAGLLGMLLLAATAGPLASAVLKTGSLRDELLLASPIVLCSIVMGFQIGALAGLEGYRRAAWSFLALMALQIGSVAYATYAYGLQGAVLGMSLNLVLRTLVCHRLLGREAARHGLESRFVWGEFARELCLRFLLPGSLTGLTALPAMWLASVALTRQEGGFTQLAFFNVAYAIRAVLLLFPSILNSVGLSLLSGQTHAGARRSFDRILLACLGLTVLSVGAGAILVLLFSDLILAAYGPDYALAEPVLRVLLLSLAAEALVVTLYQALASEHRLWRTYFFAMVPRDLTFAIMGSALGLAYGAVGLAWGHVLAWTIALIMSFVLVLRARSVRTTELEVPL